MNDENIYKRLVRNKDCNKLIESLKHFSEEYSFYFGISGSFISSCLIENFDFDFILILPDSMDFILFYQKLNLRIKNVLRISEISAKNKDVVLGTKLDCNPRIHVEIYRESTIKKLLNFEIFKIKRVKNISNGKVEEFFNIMGKKKFKTIKSFNDISDTISFLGNNEDLYWGMHFERVILSEKIIDTLGVGSLISMSKIELINQVSGSLEINDLFYCFQKDKLKSITCYYE